MKRLFFLSIVLLITFSCNTTKVFYENGKLKEKGKIIENKKNGKWKYYYKTGQLKIDSEYLDDIPNGKWVFYYENGEIKEIGYYAKDNWTTFMGRMRTNGTKNPEEHYLNKNGLWKKYYENGQLKNIGKYTEKGLQIGEWKYFSENGKLKEYRLYEQKGVGTVPSSIKRYDANGNLKE